MINGDLKVFDKFEMICVYGVLWMGLIDMFDEIVMW